MFQPVIFATLDGQPPIFANTLFKISQKSLSLQHDQSAEEIRQACRRDVQ